MKEITFALLVSSCVVTAAQAQCPEYDQQLPRLRTIMLGSSVTQNKSSHFFSYTYSITNDLRNTGCISDFEIDISRGVSQTKLSDQGLVDYPRYVDRGALTVNSQVQIVPVGIPRLPSFKGFTSAWFAGFSMDGTVDWVSAIPDYRIQPGARLDSIIMTSYGLPGFRRFVVSPSYHPKPAVVITPENEDSLHLNTPESTEEEDSVQLALINSIKVMGLTIGPTAPPLNFDASVWIDTLLSYARQSVNLGWLGKERDDDCDNDEHPQDGIERNFERRLMMAQRDLQHGDSVKARMDLQMLVNKVDRIWKRGQEEEKKQGKGKGRGKDNNVIMTSEAYALLKYNTEYLIDKLPERERHGGRDKKQQ
jgi:hypothetical protein